jgi:ATP-dependent Lon protease
MVSLFHGLPVDHPLFADFTPFAKIRTPRGDFLVPSRLAQALDTPPPVSAPAPTAPPIIPAPAVKKPVRSSLAGRNDLGSIDPQSPTLFADLKALTARILTRRHLADMDAYSAKLCAELFLGASLRMLFDEKYPSTWDEVLRYLDAADPDWDSPYQIVVDLKNTHYEFYRFDGQAADFMLGMQEDTLSILLRRCRHVLKSAVAAATAGAGLGGATSGSPRKPPGVPVFSQEAIQRALTTIGKMDEKVRSQAQQSLNAAASDDGYRALPDIHKAARNLDRLAVDFENLAEPIGHLRTELALAGAMAPAEFRIAPTLLLGEPGIGKTYLASQLANALGVPMDKISAGTAQGGFQLTGSHPSWTRAMPGSVFTLLANGASATPVLVIDEVDKIGDGGAYPIIPTLLDLLEANTARTFKDEFFDMSIDASRIVVVLTANDLDAVPEPLLSRAAVFHVPRPGVAQRLRIIQLEVAKLNQKTRRKLALDGSAQEMAQCADLDLRQTIRAVREAFSNALINGASALTIVPPSTGCKRQRIGF